jgi:hypothetical protein
LAWLIHKLTSILNLHLLSLSTAARLTLASRSNVDVHHDPSDLALAVASSSDRSKIPRRDFEPTGEAESLVGKIDQKQMGTRVGREKPKSEAVSKAKAKASAAELAERSVRRGAAGSAGQAGSYADIL